MSSLLIGALSILAIIIVVAVVSRILKSVIKTVFLLLILLSVLSGVLAYLVIQDFSDLKKNFMNESKIIYLGDQNELVAGVIVEELDALDEITFLTRAELEDLKESYQEKEYSKLLKDYYKLILIDINVFNKTLREGVLLDSSFFDGVSQDVNINISGELIKETLSSDKPTKVLADALIDEVLEGVIEEELKKNPLPDGYEVTPEMRNQLRAELESQIRQSLNEISDSQTKLVMLGLLSKQRYEENPIPKLFEDYKQKKIYVYPNTIIFRVLRFAPIQAINIAGEKFQVIREETIT